jgi:caa(3)-type oxidase subunit IV
MTTHEHAHHPTGFKQYFTTWCWLLGMTLLALGLGYVDAIQGGIKTALLVSITLAKIFLIGSIFMHLKSEKVNVIMMTFSPLILSIILFLFTFGETRHDPTHLRENVSPAFVLPTGHTKGHTEGAAEGKEAPKAEDHK